MVSWYKIIHLVIQCYMNAYIGKICNDVVKSTSMACEYRSIQNEEEA